MSSPYDDWVESVGNTEELEAFVPGGLTAKVLAWDRDEHSIAAPQGYVAAHRPIAHDSMSCAAQLEVAKECGLDAQWAVVDNSSLETNALVWEAAPQWGGPLELLTWMAKHNKTGHAYCDPYEYVLSLGGCPMLFGEYLAKLREAAENLTNASAFCCHSEVIHNAGSSLELELGWVLAKMASLGDDQPIVASMPAERQMFITIAKFRALRILSKRLTDKTPTIIAVPSRRSLTRRDWWNNQLRVTYQIMGSAFGAADIIASVSPDETLATMSKEAIAAGAKSHTVLREECFVSSVRDPSRGSHFVEDLTGQLCELGWNIYQEIAAQEGAGPVVTNGWLHDQVGRCVAERQHAIKDGALPITGVTEYPSDDPVPDGAELKTAQVDITWECQKLTMVTDAEVAGEEA